MAAEPSAEPVALHFLAIGRGDPVVFIPGLGSSGAVWAEIAQALADDACCILVDNRGAGLSPKPQGPYSTAAMAADVAALVERLGLGAVCVVGHSMGGAVAQELALAHPDRVRRLALLSTWCEPDPWLTGLFVNLRRLRQHLPLREFVEFHLWLSTAPASDRDPLRRRELAEQVYRAARRQGWRAYLAQLDACLGHRAGERVHAIRAPTLVAVGSEDRVVPPRLSQELALRIARVQFEVIEGAGHRLYYEAPGRLVDLLKRWLTAPTPGPGPG